VGAILQSPCPSVRPSVHTFVTYISASTGRNDFIFDIWLWHGDLYRVSCQSHISNIKSFLPVEAEITVTKVFITANMENSMSHCKQEVQKCRCAVNSYLSFYWKKWFYIWNMTLAWWLVPCLPFPGLPHIYFLFTVRLTNERMGVFLARRSVQHLVFLEME
jgi:hypothetical protein